MDSVYVLPTNFFLGAHQPWQWSAFEPEYDNDGKVVQWHQEPALAPPELPGYVYLYQRAPYPLRQEACAKELMAAYLWEQVPELKDFEHWDGSRVYLDTWVPAGVPFDWINAGYALNRVKGWDRQGEIWCGREDDTQRFYIEKTIV